MEVLALRYLQQKYQQKKEGFSQTQAHSVSALLVLTWTVVATLWAIGSSWHCNTVLQSQFGWKLLHALFAGMFPTLYLLLRYLNVLRCPTPLM